MFNFHFVSFFQIHLGQPAALNDTVYISATGDGTKHMYFLFVIRSMWDFPTLLLNELPAD